MKAGIVGGGIMGQYLAYSLLERGCEVALFDRSAPYNCSQAAGGLLTPLAELAQSESSIFELGIEALFDHWPALIKKLPEQVYFKQDGSLVLAHPNDAAELKNFIQLVSKKLQQDQLPRVLNKHEITELEPSITQFNTGYYLAHEGQIDNQQLLTVLEKYLIAQGVVWHSHSNVAKIKPHEITVNNEKYCFDWVFDCRGLQAKDQFKDLRGVRGEIIWLSAKDVTITRPIRLLHPRYRLYIVPRPEQIYLLGASELESEESSPISVRTTLELLTAAYCVDSNFAEARIIKTVTALRPTLSDHLPKINYAPGFCAVNGLYRHGFLIAPTLANEIVNRIFNGKTMRWQSLWECSNEN